MRRDWQIGTGKRKGIQMGEPKCQHLNVVRSIAAEKEWRCVGCCQEFYHLGDIGFPGEKITIMEPYATLRDQFAMAAMQGDWAAQDASNDGSGLFLPSAKDESLRSWAVLYYRMADAMLEVRKPA